MPVCRTEQFSNCFSIIYFYFTTNSKLHFWGIFFQINYCVLQVLSISESNVPWYEKKFQNSHEYWLVVEPESISVERHQFSSVLCYVVKKLFS